MAVVGAECSVGPAAAKSNKDPCPQLWKKIDHATKPQSAALTKLGMVNDSSLLRYDHRPDTAAPSSSTVEHPRNWLL